jgi:hypothetical protein
VEHLFDIEKTGIVQVTQNVGIGFEMKFALTGSDDGAPESVPYCAEIAGVLRILNGAHISPDLLPLSTAQRIDGAKSLASKHESRPLTRKSLGCSDGAGGRDAALPDRNVVDVRLRKPCASPDLPDRDSALA